MLTLRCYTYDEPQCISEMEPLTIAPGEIDIWTIKFYPEKMCNQSLKSVLSQEELKRSERFVVKHKRDKYLFYHAALRFILYRYQSHIVSGPEELQFESGSSGKPKLIQTRSQLDFNLTHSGNFGWVAITSLTSIGLDVEEILPSRLRLPLGQVLSVSEIELLDQVCPAVRAQVFTRLWTRKEAYVKALGTSMGIYPARIDMSSTFTEVGTIGATMNQQQFCETFCHIDEIPWIFYDRPLLGDQFWATLACSLKA